jgi:8-oxo-dGTP diphosphatase
MTNDQRPLAIVVTAAVVQRQGCYLVTRRLKGTHLEGCWEFPGGKCLDGESLAACLARELREELAVGVRIAGELLTTTHAYADRHVTLHFFKCELLGDPSPQLGQEMRWVPAAELPTLDFPPADDELIAALTTPQM